MTLLHYSNTAPVLTLTGGVNNLVTTLPVAAHSPMGMSTPYRMTIEYQGANPEVVQVTDDTSPTSLIVLRGQDGTTATSHSAGASLTHTMTAGDLGDAANHVAASTGVHGIAGAVVGTTDVQVLGSKTLTTPIVNQGVHNASSSAPAITTKAAATGTQDTQQWQDSAGVMKARVSRTGGGEFKQLNLPNDTAGSNVLTVQGAASQTAKLGAFKDSSANELATVDAEGKVAITPVVSSSTPLLKLKSPAAGTAANPLEVQDSAGTVVARIGPAGDYIATGFSLNANGGFAKLGTVDGKFQIDSTSAIVMSGAKITADVTQSNNVITTSTKLGKRIHWGSASVTTDASNYATITHGAGFTPTMVLPGWIGQNLAGGPQGIIGADTFTATTFRVRVANGPSATMTIGFVCYE